MARVRFVGDCLRRGLKLAWAAAGLWGTVTVLFGLVGVSVADWTLLRLPLIGVAGILAVLALMILGEGAYRREQELRKTWKRSGGGIPDRTRVRH